MWDYSQMSKAAKSAGGPDLFMKGLVKVGERNAYIRAGTFGIGLACVAGLGFYKLLKNKSRDDENRMQDVNNYMKLNLEDTDYADSEDLMIDNVELAEYIVRNSDLEQDDVELILETEMNYLESIGIITEKEDINSDFQHTLYVDDLVNYISEKIDVEYDVIKIVVELEREFLEQKNVVILPSNIKET